MSFGSKVHRLTHRQRTQPYLSSSLNDDTIINKKENTSKNNNQNLKNKHYPVVNTRTTTSVPNDRSSIESDNSEHSVNNIPEYIT